MVEINNAREIYSLSTPADRAEIYSSWNNHNATCYIATTEVHKIIDMHTKSNSIDCTMYARGMCSTEL